MLNRLFLNLEGVVKMMASFNKFRRAVVKNLDVTSNACFSELLKERASDLGIAIAMDAQSSNIAFSSDKELF